MEENKEYCTGQQFEVVFTTMFNRLWQCNQCAFGVLQPLTETEPSLIPMYHPKPIPKQFTVSDEQKARLKAMIEEDRLP